MFVMLHGHRDIGAKELERECKYAIRSYPVSRKGRRMTCGTSTNVLTRTSCSEQAEWKDSDTMYDWVTCVGPRRIISWSAQFVI